MATTQKTQHPPTAIMVTCPACGHTSGPLANDGWSRIVCQSVECDQEVNHPDEAQLSQQQCADLMQTIDAGTLREMPLLVSPSGWDVADDGQHAAELLAELLQHLSSSHLAELVAALEDPDADLPNWYVLMHDAAIDAALVDYAVRPPTGHGLGVEIYGGGRGESYRKGG